MRVEASSTTVLTAALATALVLAGCTGGGSGGANPLQTAASAEFGESTGGVQGLVVNEEFQPVEGAQVVLGELELDTLTDVEGRFAFSNVEPGAYELQVLRLGYKTVLRQIEVEAGRVAEVDITLKAVAVAEAFHTTHIRRGLFGCGASWTPGIPPEPAPGFDSLPGGSGGLPNRIGGLAGCGVLSSEFFNGTPLYDLDQFSMTWEVNRSTQDWLTSVFEMQWTSNQLAGRGLLMTWEVEDCFNNPEFEFVTEEGASPLRGVANESVIQGVIANGTEQADKCGEGAANCNEDGCQILSRVFATEETTGSEEADIGFSFQQQYELFHTFFIMEPAPEGFTALDET